MARHLALDWDYQQLRIVAATVRPGGLRIEQAIVWEEEQSPNIAEAEILGRHLRERLKAANIAPAPVLACVGRDRVILREVHYPSVAAAEEPAIVRFQVLKELTDSSSEVVIDYTPLGEAAPGEERRALVLTVRRELLTAYQSLCHSAGLKLLALTPRPFGTLACLRESLRKRQGTGAFEEVQRNSSPHAAIALLTAADNWSEFCLVHGDTMLLARSLPAGPTLPAEVRRNIATYTAQSSRHVVSALYLAGNGETLALQESLQEALGIPARSFDPFVGAEETALPGQNRGAFAGAVGLLRLQGAGQRLPINFVSPKQPEVARDPNKRRLAVVAGIAAVLLLGVFSYCYAQLAGLDRQLENLQLTQMTLKERMVQVDEDDKRFKELNEWLRGNICWLDELYDLTARLPLNAIRLFEFRGELKLRIFSKEAAKDKPGQITLTLGTTADHKAVDDLLNQMGAESGHYMTHRKEPTSATMKLPGFPEQFKALIDVEKPPPDKYKELKLASAQSNGFRTAAHPRGPNRADVGTVAVSLVDRNRVAIPQQPVRVKLVVPATPVDAGPKGVPARGATPVKNPAPPPALEAPVAAPPVQHLGESFEAILDAQRTGDASKAQAIIEQGRAQEKVREMNRGTAPPATAPAGKGKTP